MAFQRNQEQQEQEKNLENSYLGPEPELQQQQQQQQQMNSGLARYRSAPSSYFSSFLDAAASNVNNSSSRGGDYSVDDLDNFLDGLIMPSNEIISVQEHGSSSNNRFSSSKRMNINETQFVASKHVQDCYNRRTIFQPQDHHQQQFNNDHVDDSYRFLSSMDKGVTNSNLIRYNSSPAGLFSGLNIVNDGNNQPSGLMSPLPEIADRSIGERDPFSTAFVTENEDNEVFENGAATAAATAMFPLPCTSAMLSRHLSMPTTSTELYGVETLMQDSVLCKFRAKRGCATHPRSIAERVRRTRISERMRKLQQLVPNMEKQSNTSDMLDLAVDYIKALQKQVKTLSEKRSQCTCSKHL